MTSTRIGLFYGQRLSGAGNLALPFCDSFVGNLSRQRHADQSTFSGLNHNPGSCTVEGEILRTTASPATARTISVPAPIAGRWFLIASAIILLLMARPARAQLLVGVDDPFEPIWALDLVTNQATPVLTGFGCVAMAVDANTNTLYFMTNTVTLYRWNLGNPSDPPTLVGTTRNASGANISLTGLAFDTAANKLVASRTLDSSAGPEGFYEVDVSTATATLRFGTVASQYDFGGFDYDVASGNFYANSDGSNRGIYRIDFGDNSVNFVAPYPAVTTLNPPDIDGLAVGAGKIFMVEDRAVQVGGKVYVFDLATGLYEEPLQTPWFFNEVFAGATYIPNFEEFMSQIPEPTGASALLLSLFAGAARVGRRRAVRSYGKGWENRNGHVA